MALTQEERDKMAAESDARIANRQAMKKKAVKKKVVKNPMPTTMKPIPKKAVKKKVVKKVVKKKPNMFTMHTKAIDDAVDKMAGK